jgi:hypothetical protein
MDRVVTLRSRAMLRASSGMVATYPPPARPIGNRLISIDCGQAILRRMGENPDLQEPIFGMMQAMTQRQAT